MTYVASYLLIGIILGFITARALPARERSGITGGIVLVSAILWPCLIVRSFMDSKR